MENLIVLTKSTIEIDTPVKLGNYPQSKVTDETLLRRLNAISGPLPTSTNCQAWTDYGYYIRDSVSSYMWYIDIVIENEKYRGVYFTNHRPYGIVSLGSLQDENGYMVGSVYWFKYESIIWRVLEVQNNKALLMSFLALDSQPYHYSNTSRIIGGNTIQPNNYEHSHIRSWLNNVFYNTAFNSVEKERIEVTTVDNSVASTGYSSNPNICDNTRDRVFLLSRAEVNTFKMLKFNRFARKIKSSAYALSQGVDNYSFRRYSHWLLRSPTNASQRDGSADGLLFVNHSGDIKDNMIACYTAMGIVPGLWVSLSEIQHVEEESEKKTQEIYEKVSVRPMKYYIKAVGVTFSNRQRVIACLSVGQTLRFVPEPDNPYDRFAVKIETLSGEQVGYISRDYNQEVFINLRGGKAKYEPVVSSITGGGFDTMYGVNIEVTMTELI